ncbi:MAG: hypothetical protein WKF47_19980 [Geodermatophilaceae bacterium]
MRLVEYGQLTEGVPLVGGQVDRGGEPFDELVPKWESRRGRDAGAEEGYELPGARLEREGAGLVPAGP